METNIQHLTATTKGTARIYPEEPGNMSYWSRKWHVSPQELQEAILYTGSLDPGTLKNYLKRDSWVYHPVDSSLKILKNTMDFIF